MKKIVLLLSLSMALNTLAQVGIGTDNPDASAILDVKSDSKGFLPPRVALQSLTDVTTIANPAEGLVVYNTTTNNLTLFAGLYFYNGTEWAPTAPYPTPGNTPVANIVNDAAPGYGGFTGATPPTGMTVTNLNGFVQLAFGGNTDALFNGNLADVGNQTMHFQRSNTSDDWGQAFTFDKRIRFTQVDLNGRTNGGTGVVNRIANVVIQVVLADQVQWTSAIIGVPVNVNSNIVTIPNVIGNEIRVVILNGANNGDTSGGATDLINYDELIISGEM